MEKTIKRTAAWVGTGFIVLLAVIIINQLHSVFVVTSAVNINLGRIVTGILAIFFFGIFAMPLIGFMKLRKPLEIPDREDEAAYGKYLAAIKKRLVKNPLLKAVSHEFDGEREISEQILSAYSVLDREAEKIIKETASTVFLTTAVSQNGVLDGLFVMTSLSRMVWKVSHIYNQRPNIKDIFQLYINVAVTVLMAREIEDLAILDEQLQPVVNSLIGGTIGTLVPGAAAVSNLIVSSVIEGSANALLALRVGVIAKKYMTRLEEGDKRLIRRSATIEACKLLGTVVQVNSVNIVKSFVKASKRATIDRTIDGIKTGADKTIDGIKTGAGRTGSFVKDIFKKESKKEHEEE
ncbi:protein of unknown function [Dethiosulfatibacter aminovorans DSM 17477]|uniref:DUF697 domain-containing protein n=1 Tax=Dethiosulfatibacter aminovorans DSM 17477 TaxID=1121476 RepID=A0A1M6HEJ7_9FIRM|nr:DUF697 domain-containing protein [Dethiosulfatibacter aminovorans]SHJ20637.1 protein of unknown function [Dethiosulfatibacter aminovorans DSM 17477]